MKIVLATGNTGKIKEIRSVLAHPDYDFVSQQDFATPEVAETGLSFVENAIIKARHACDHTGLPALADDSGLSVDVLEGAPGIYSARYAGTDAGDTDNINKLLQALENTNNRTAAFHCVLVFMRHAHDPVPLIAHGSWQGEITKSPQGNAGFGYDPVFYLQDKNCTAAELSQNEKNKLSHRGQALRLLAAQLS